MRLEMVSHFLHLPLHLHHSSSPSNHQVSVLCCFLHEPLRAWLVTAGLLHTEQMRWKDEMCECVWEREIEKFHIWRERYEQAIYARIAENINTVVSGGREVQKVRKIADCWHIPFLIGVIFINAALKVPVQLEVTILWYEIVMFTYFTKKM